MAALSVVSFAKMQPHTKLSVLHQSGMNNSDLREVIILRKKVPVTKSKSSTTLMNNNTTTMNNNMKMEQDKCDSLNRKKPPTCGGGGVIRNQHLPTVAVARRNARERNRVQQVNKGFETLRQHIPASIASSFTTTENSGRGASKKLSKVETLRMAVEYIRSLQKMLATDDSEVEQSVSSPGSVVKRGGGFEQDQRHDTSPVIVDDEFNYEDDSRDSCATKVAHLERMCAPHLQTIYDTEQMSFDYQKLYNYDYRVRAERDENLVPQLPHTPAGLRLGNRISLTDPKAWIPETLKSEDMNEKPSSSLSPGMYSEQSLSPAGDPEPTSANSSFLMVPEYARPLRPLASMVGEQAVQHTYHLMQQMPPIKEELKDEGSDVSNQLCVMHNWMACKSDL